MIMNSDKPLRVVVCGSRDWFDPRPIRLRLRQLPAGSTVIHGNCKGADQLGGKIAESLGFAVVVVHAEWEKHGRMAGPIRNSKMLDMDPDLVLCFHEDIFKSHGSIDTVQKAITYGIPYEIIKRWEKQNVKNKQPQ